MIGLLFHHERFIMSKIQEIFDMIKVSCRKTGQFTIQSPVCKNLKERFVDIKMVLANFFQP